MAAQTYSTYAAVKDQNKEHQWNCSTGGHQLDRPSCFSCCCTLRYCGVVHSRLAWPGGYSDAGKEGSLLTVIRKEVPTLWPFCCMVTSRHGMLLIASRGLRAFGWKPLRLCVRLGLEKGASRPEREEAGGRQHVKMLSEIQLSQHRLRN